MDVQRSKLIRDLRTLLYTRDSEVVIKVTNSVQPEDSPTGADEAIDLLEDIIANSVKEEDGGKGQLTEIYQQLAKDTKLDQQLVKNIKVEASPKTMATDEVKIGSTSLKLETLKKDFKFSGQIGDNSKTNCIGYMSFLRQVAMAQKRGYSDADIVDGVIRAIHPTANIRGCLEGRDSLTLPTLQTIIRSYYKEKTSTELYQELCTLAQSPQESAQEFLFRAMELRQKIIFASKEDASLSYEAKLVEQQFRHTITTGLRDDMVRAEFQLILAKYDSDESLLQSLNEIVKRRQGRLEKLETVAADSPRVRAVKSDNVSTEIIRELKALRVQVEEIKQSRREEQQPKLGIRRLAHVVKARYNMATEPADHLYSLVKEGFKDACNYDKYRPDYTPIAVDEVVSMLLGNHPITQGMECDILELGAGTGKLTQRLLERLSKDRKYIASEPMPDFIATLRKHCPNVDARQFSAEFIPLPDNSVQGIVAAQCFHWFANEQATDEITRVLKPGGNLVLLWNEKDKRAGWINTISSIIHNHLVPGDPSYRSKEWKQFMDDYKSLTLKCRKYLDYPLMKHTKDSIINHYSTVSVFARMPEGDRQKALSDIRRVLDTDPETKDKDMIPFPMYTDVCHYVKS